MLWVAAHLPQLSLETFRATLSAEQASRPAALVAEHRIQAVDRLAAERGVQPGQKRATALALAPELLLGQADAARDAQALLAVAHAALAFTPCVTLQGPAAGQAAADSVLLDVQASLRCFGGARRLLQRLRTAWAPLAHQLSLASAPTALGAAWLARSGWPAAQRHPRTRQELQARLGLLPAWLADPEHGETLQGMGLHTLAELRALPRSGLARRFGEALLAGIDRAWGDAPDPRDWLELPETFTGRLELQHRADNTEQVLHGAQVLLAQLVAWAQARCAQVAAFTLLMHHERRHRGEHPPATQLDIELAEPGNDAAHLQLLLRERLARCTLAAPTLDLELRCHRLRAGAAPSGELFPSRQAEAEGLTRLLERLRARLGDEQVQWLQPHADHRPEQGTRLVAGEPRRRAAPGAAAGKAAPLQRPLQRPLHRPLWLLPRAQPLAAPQAAPQFEGRTLQLLAGPERVEAGWWDEALATRDYFIAQDGDGSLLWVYRQRLPLRPDDDEGQAHWMLQGRFA